VTTNLAKTHLTQRRKETHLEARQRFASCAFAGEELRGLVWLDLLEADGAAEGGYRDGGVARAAYSRDSP
jgi:hypothetical protein